MTNAERFANFLILTQDDESLFTEGIQSFDSTISNILELENVRCVAFADGSYLIDSEAEDYNTLVPFATAEELFKILIETASTMPDGINKLRQIFMSSTGDSHD